MINSKKIRLALRSVLIDADLTDLENYAWEGRPFNPSGKCLWIRETLLPTIEMPSAQNTPESTNIMQYDIFTPAGSGTETMEDFADSLADLFDPDNAHIEFDEIKIIFDRTERRAKDDDDTWQWIPVDIYFRAVL
jgi:hypothetical protein